MPDYYVFLCPGRSNRFVINADTPEEALEMAKATPGVVKNPVEGVNFVFEMGDGNTKTLVFREHIFAG